MTQSIGLAFVAGLASSVSIVEAFSAAVVDKFSFLSHFGLVMVGLVLSWLHWKCDLNRTKARFGA